jgi:two-component system CheB/CheR fusion protein
MDPPHSPPSPRAPPDGDTELKARVDELARANGELRKLMAATAIAAVFLDRDLRITLFTPAAVELFNLIPTDVGRPLADLASRLDHGQIVADVRSVLEHLAPIEREVRVGARWLFARVLPYRSEGDRIGGVVLTYLDITGRRNVEDALRESERRFRVVLGQAAAGVAHTDLAGTITLGNARFAQITGRSEEALVGTSIFELVHADDRARNIAAFRAMVEHGKPFEMEQRFLRADGGVVDVNTAVTTTTDAAGRAIGAFVVVLDITQREETQRALRESEERLRLVVENSREFAILSTDLDRRVRTWNIGAREITGYHPSEIIGESADLLFVEEDRAAGVPAREARQALMEGSSADERWHRRRDGSRFWGSGVMTVMRGEGGAEPIGFVKIFRDQTQARAAAQALEQSRAELVQALIDNRRARAEVEAASLAKDRFLAVLSHELRTPLTPIVMALHALERDPALTPSLRGTVELIRRNVKAELTLIDDLLDVTRISTGKLEIAVDRTDMHEVVCAALAVCESDFASKRQRFEAHLDAERSIVAGDAARLQQVVWNLLKNASKFTPAEGEIQLATSNLGKRFVLVVADTGIGIAAAALETIFDAFAQEGSWVTSEFGGLGLGLAIAKSTVEAHHGTLTAASGGRDQGATFTIELPLD